MPLWWLLHTLYSIWTAGLGQVEKDLLQTPNCVQLSNKALLSLKEKRIKNSCYNYSGKENPYSQITGSPSSLIELWQQQPSHFSFFPSIPSTRLSQRVIIVCCKEWTAMAQNYFQTLNARQCSSLFALRTSDIALPISKISLPGGKKWQIISAFLPPVHTGINYFFYRPSFSKGILIFHWQVLVVPSVFFVELFTLFNILTVR